MNRTQLTEKIMADFGLTKPEANTAVEAVLTTIMRTVAAGEDVKIPRFGTIRRALFLGRTHMNLATGERVSTPDRYMPRFRPGPQFLDAVRSGDTSIVLRKGRTSKTDGGN